MNSYVINSLVWDIYGTVFSWFGPNWLSSGKLRICSLSAHFLYFTNRLEASRVLLLAKCAVQSLACFICRTIPSTFGLWNWQYFYFPSHNFWPHCNAEMWDIILVGIVLGPAFGKSDRNNQPTYTLRCRFVGLGCLRDRPLHVGAGPIRLQEIENHSFSDWEIFLLFSTGCSCLSNR